MPVPAFCECVDDLSYLGKFHRTLDISLFVVYTDDYDAQRLASRAQRGAQRKAQWRDARSVRSITLLGLLFWFAKNHSVDIVAWARILYGYSCTFR